MSDCLSIALAQINPTVGDVRGNVRHVLHARKRAAAADLVVFPELALSGYPPEDLVLKEAFLDAVKEGVAKLAAATAEGGPAILIGAPWRVDGLRRNAVLLIDGGAIQATVLKHHLANYGVFDEARVFVAGAMPQPVVFRGIRLGVMICEDMRFADVAKALRQAGAQVLIVPNGSPFEVDKPTARLAHATARVADTGLPLIYVNQIGGQDDLVFDGSSFVLDADGRLVHQVPSWREDIALSRWSRSGASLVCLPGRLSPPVDRLENIYRAMMLGLGDYVAKSGQEGILVGLSGGIDSALSAAVAADALGPDRVSGVVMPSPHTSRQSLDDAAETARLNGIRLETIGIGPALASFETMVPEVFCGADVQRTVESLTLMAIGDKSGRMVLSTGNKSEISVGEDMCGGYAVLKDVYKTTVFELARWRNRARPEGALGAMGPVMTDRVLAESASAAERSLPPYQQLDAILHCLIEQEMGPAEVIATGHEPSAVRRVFRLLDRAEGKRRQAPPGVKITSRAFGRDRRYPIVNGFTDII